MLEAYLFRDQLDECWMDVEWSVIAVMLSVQYALCQMTFLEVRRRPSPRLTKNRPPYVASCKQ